MKVKRFKPGFTLAEVLITLGIIGVVAAMTIPTLMNKTGEAEFKTAYKKAYSAASQAWMMAVNDDKSVDLPGVGDNQPQRLANFAALQSYFKVTKSCGDASTATLAAISDCWAAGDMWWSSYPKASGVAFIDNSGMAWALVVADSDTNFNEILVDTNGSKKPNKLGMDRFHINIVGSDGVSGYGTLTRITPSPDCLSATDCAGYSSANICPNVASHPCYYTKWLIN